MPWRSHAMPAPAVLEARCCVGAAAQRMLARRPRRALAKASDCASIEVLNLAATSSEFHWQFKSDEAPARHSHALGEEEARWERMLQVRAGALSLLAPAPRRLHVMLAMSMPIWLPFVGSILQWSGDGKREKLANGDSGKSYDERCKIMIFCGEIFPRCWYLFFD